MKKLTTTVTVNGEIKIVSAWLDERTVEALEQANDEELTRQYIIDAHEEYLVELKETRRHQSLSNGFDVIDERTNIERNYEISELNNALKTLTEKQREVFLARVLDGETFREIGEQMNISKQTVYELYNAAVKKLKNFLG